VQWMRPPLPARRDDVLDSLVLRIAVANSFGTITTPWQVVVKPAVELCMRGEKIRFGRPRVPPLSVCC
jgi:hypothetical protein